MENKSAPIFCDRQVYKFLPINLGACKPIFYFFLIHHIWGERLLWGAVFIIQTSYKMQYFTIFQDKLHSFNIQDYRSTRGLLISETVQKISKSPIRPAGSNFWQAPNLQRNFKRITLQRDKEFIECIFYSWFYNDV